jgi:hypothetical protein
VESIPGKASGAWVGTRMPVQTVFENLEAGISVADITHLLDVLHENAQCSRRWPRLVKLYLDIVLMPSSLRQIVGRLHSYPNVGRGPESLGKPDGHIGGHARLAVNET